MSRVKTLTNNIQRIQIDNTNMQKIDLNGKTILVNTLEIPELQKVADYCAIFCDGKIVKVLPHEQIEEHTIMMYSTNSIQEQTEVENEE